MTIYEIVMLVVKGVGFVVLTFNFGVAMNVVIEMIKAVSRHI